MIRTEYSLSKNAMNLGAITGLVISGIQLLLYAVGINDLSWLLYLILVFAISWGARKYREMSDGYMSFGQVVGFGTLLSVGSSLVFGFFNYLYTKFIDSSFIDELLVETEMSLLEGGYPDDKVDAIMELYNTFFGPGAFALGLFFNYVLLGFIAALIVGAVLKNPKPMFD